MANESWVRRLKLLQHIIVRGNIQTAEAAEHLGVNKRIALSDLKELAKHDVPLRHPSLGNARESLDRDTVWELSTSWAALGFDAGIMGRLSLLLGREVIAHFMRGTVFHEKLEQIDELIAKLASGIDENIERRFYLKQEPAKQYEKQSSLLEDIVYAIVRRSPISFDYEAASGRRMRNDKVNPLTLIIYRRGLYVTLDRKQGTRGRMSLAIDRITNLELHLDGEPFDYPPASEYDPKTHFADIFGIFDDGEPAREVVLRFPASGSQVYAREREWMPNQIIEIDDEGVVTIRFKARGAELPFRILEYGPFCEVVSPPELRAKVAELAQQTAAMYAGKPVEKKTPTKPRRSAKDK